MTFSELPAEEQNRYREFIRGQFSTELAQLIGRAWSVGLVIEVDYRRASPLSKPAMVPTVRHARGFYLKEL